MANLISKPGITNASTLAIPKNWDATWFRGIISNLLQGADVRNAVGSGGISITGNISTPYATIGFAAPVTLPAPVTIKYNPSTPNTSAVPSLTVLAPGSDAVVTETGRALMVGGQPNAFAAEIVGSATSGQSYGLAVRAGSTSVDRALQIENAAATGTYMQINGDGHGFIAAQIGGGGGLFWDVNSAFTFNSPGAGVTITVGKAATGTASLRYGGTAASSFWAAPGNIDLGTSGGDYGSVGYNFRATTTAGSYQADVADLASKIQFNLGGFLFQTAPSVSAGSAQTYTTRMSILSSGNFGIFSAAGTGAGQSTGWGTPTGNVKVANFPGATATLLQTSETLAQLLLDLKAWGYLGA